MAAVSSSEANSPRLQNSQRFFSQPSGIVRRASNTFSAAIDKFQTSLNEAGQNPNSIKKAVLITTVLLADMGIFATSITVPGLLFSIIVVPLAIVSQSGEDKPVLYEEQQAENKKQLLQIAFVTSTVLFDLGFLISAAPAVSFFVSAVVLPAVFLNNIDADQVLYLKVFDEEENHTVRPFTVTRLYSDDMGVFGYFIRGIFQGKKAVLKVFKDASTDLSSEAQKEAENEIFYLKKLKGSYGIVRLVGQVQILGDTKRGIILEDGGEDLLQYKNERAASLNCRRIETIARKILKALEAMHNHKNEKDGPDGVVHGDLKSENVLVSKYENRQGKTRKKITLIDFGKSHENKKEPRTMDGTQACLAPEIFSEEEQDCKVDMWALGVMLFELIGGKIAENPNENAHIENDDNSLIWRLAKKFSETKKTAPEDLERLTVDYQKKIYDQIDRHVSQRQFSGYKRLVPLIKGLLCIDQQKRWDAQEALVSLQGFLKRPEAFTESLQNLFADPSAS